MTTLFQKCSAIEPLMQTSSSALQRKGFDGDEGFPSKNSLPHPPFEKMKSCDYSVEVSSESSDDEEYFPWRTDKFAKQKEAGNKELLLVSFDDEVEERQEPESLDIYDIAFKKKCCEWKLGALDKGKRQSPVESDDLTSFAPSPLKVDVETLWGVPSQSSFFEEKKPRKSEHLESEKSLPIVIKKTELKKKKDKATPLDKSVVTPKKNKVSAVKKRVRRHCIGKQKRNRYEIFVPDVDNKVKKETFPKKKSTTRQKQKPQKSISSSKSSGIPSGYSCVDSGVSAGNSYNSNGGNQSETYTNGANGGSNCGGGGGGGFHKKGGLGGHGGDDQDGKKPFSHVDVNMEEEEETDDDDDVKMTSKSGSDMDCNEGQELVNSTSWEKFSFKGQDLQHSAYCRNDKCTRPLCQEVKREIHHVDSHKCDVKCFRCCKIFNLLKYHAANCKIPCCRVYLCKSLREQRDVAKQPAQVPPQAPRPPCIPIWNSQPDVDGLVVLNNTDLNIGTRFQEYLDYTKSENVGNGKNGYVYKVSFPATSPLYNLPNQVVKETEYPISTEEIKVYKCIGDHRNIVKHNLVAMKGRDGHASIFMNKCDMSLKDKLHNHCMDDKECIFYFHQVVDGIKHIHDNGVIHKDIKAQNILLSALLGDGEHFRAMLADFDAAMILENEFTISGLRPMGTRGFASPEVMEKRPHGRPSDIYSLGCLLLEMKGIMPQHDQLDRQLEELKMISPDLSRIVELCVQKDPEKRPTAAHIQNFLQECSVTDAVE